jgi:hypothetical protein
MWYDVSCATVKYLAVCRVPGVAPLQMSVTRRLLDEMEAREAEIVSLKAEAENAALKIEIMAREADAAVKALKAEIVALKGRGQGA